MRDCQHLRVIPTRINLASLEEVDMSYCLRLKSFPDISSNIKILSVKATKKKGVPPSVVGRLFRLECLEIGSINLKILLTYVPLSVTSLDLSNNDIMWIPDCVIRLPYLVDLIVENCSKLVSVPVLSPTLESLNVKNCVSLKRIYFSLRDTYVPTFYNGLKLDEEARRGIVQQSMYEYVGLLGKEVPAKFTHKVNGNSITIPLDLRGITDTISSVWLSDLSTSSEHLFIYRGSLFLNRNSGCDYERDYV